MSIRVTPITEQFLQKFARTVKGIDGSCFYYMPYWLEKVGEGEYVQHSFDDLPEELKKRVVEMMVERFGKDKVAYKILGKGEIKVVADCKN